MSDVDTKIDPTTGDYIRTAGGTFLMSDPLENKIALSLTLELGSWEGDPLLGQRFTRELARTTDGAVTRIRLQRFVLQALQWLLDSGDLTAASVTVEEVEAGEVAFETVCRAPGRDPIRQGWRIALGGS